MIEILNNYLINDISLIVNEYYKPATFLQIFDYIKNKSNITKILDLTAKNLEENNYNYKIVNTIYDIINDEKVYLINLTFENIYDFNNPKCKNIIYYGTIKYIDTIWLYNNNCVESVSFNFPYLEKIYNIWMTKCYNLINIDFNLPNLRKISYYWLYNAKSLQELEINLPKLEYVGKEFLLDCDKLTKLLINTPLLKNINNNFFINI
jgi:hypothetical protein